MQHADDLRVLDVDLGTRLEYCMRAVSVLGAGVEGYSSLPACDTVTVQFESRVLGRVLSAEGQLPVADVTVEWRLMPDTWNPNNTLDDSTTMALALGETVTNGDGEFTIHVLTENWSRLEAVLLLLPHKTSGNFTHHFTDLGGAPVSLSEPLWLSEFEHFAFDRTVVLRDVSTVPVTGRVSFPNAAPQAMAGFDDSDAPTDLAVWPTYNPRNSCPLADVEVCAYDHVHRTLLACVRTAHDGTYSLPLRTGARAELVLRKGSHREYVRVAGPASGVHITTEPSMAPGAAPEDMAEVFFIDEPGELGSPWRGVDFEDHHVRLLNLEVYGTLCQRPLGLSTFALQFEECFDQRLLVDSLGQQFLVPAQAYHLTMLEVREDDSGEGALRPDITDADEGGYFHRMGTRRRFLNLTEASVTSTYRYMPLPQLELVVAGALRPAAVCGNVSWTSQLAGTAGMLDSMPEYVVSAGKKYVFTVRATQQSSASQPACDHVEEMLEIASAVGLSADEEQRLRDDPQQFQAVRRSLGAVSMDELSRCRTFDQCPQPLGHTALVQFATTASGRGCAPGWLPVSNVDDCQAAGASIGLGSRAVVRTSDDPSFDPPGCFTSGLSGTLWFNPTEGSTSDEDNSRNLTVFCRRERKYGAQAATELWVGMSERQPDYAKVFRARVVVEGYARPAELEARLLVTGVRFISDESAVPMPTHLPLTVLYDPPGGSSYAFYNNIELRHNLTLSLGDNQVGRYIEHFRRDGLKMDSTISKDVAAEAPPGSGVSFGTSIAIPLTSGGFHDGSKTTNDHVQWTVRETETGAELRVQFSYATSRSPLHAGHGSDVFLVPSLTIITSKSEQVQFDAEQCLIQHRDVQTWTVDPDNTGFYFITQHQ